MTILNFVTQEELDNLDGDPRIAFMELVNIAQRRFSEQTSKLDPDDRYQWDQREELRHSFMNVIFAAAKRLEVEPFMSMSIPTHQDFRENDYRQFKSDLDYYVTQIMLDNSIKSKRNLVEILPDSKDKIKRYVRELRKCIESANMSPSKRKTLLDKVNDFEKELEKRRTSMISAALLTFEVLAIPGATWASVDIAHKLINNVMQTVAEAKAKEQENKQLSPYHVPKALSSPRPIESKPVSTTSGDLDDEIPF